MDNAIDKEDLAKKIAENLQMFDRVYYDTESLIFDGVLDDWLWEYRDYLDLSDEDFNEIDENELGGWQREVVFRNK